MIRRGLVQLVVGMALGVGAAVEVCQLMSGLLFKVSPRDPLTFGAVSAILAAVGLIACWMPSRRAARVDPVRALRCD
jgi:ABC-type antimicrobial peptide transport system permease subunit